MQKIEVNAMTALIDAEDIPPAQGAPCGWGWTHWDGPDHGKLYIVYRCHEKYPEDEKPDFWYEVYVEGEYHCELSKGIDFRQWALENGWRPVVSYLTAGGHVQ